MLVPYDRPEIATETISKFDNKRIVATLVYRLERNQVGVNVNSASWWALNSGANSRRPLERL